MNKENINPETVISRSDSLISNNLGEDIVMMDIDEGSYYGLESVAARIWELTEEPVSVATICKTLTSEYDVPEQKCLEEVAEFVGDLLTRKIIQIAKQ